METLEIQIINFAQKYMNEERIRDEARKAANRSQFMSNHIYDHKSYEDGFYEGMNQVLRQTDVVCCASRKFKNTKTVKMKFKDAPVGARFKYPKSDKVWVKINSNPKGQFNDGNGLICSWNGNVEGHQSFCSFVDEELGIDFDTEVELV